MKVIGYLRVSTDAQVEGYGKDVQEADIRRWCKANGHRLVGLLADDGVSGALSERDGLGEALRMVRAGEVGAIVVGKLDRLARDLVFQEQALAEVWAHGGEVYSTLPTEANLRNDEDDPSRKMIRHILGAVNEWEREMIRLRMRNGRRAKAATGGYAYGAPPFGYRAEGRGLVPDPDEAATVARIRELRAEGSSLRQIAETLTAEGRPTKRGGTVWHPPTVARVLERAKVPTA